MTKNYIFLFICTFLISACSKNKPIKKLQDISFGKSVYYPSSIFNIISERNDTLEKTIEFYFNDWSKEQDASATLLFYNVDGLPLDSNSNFRIYLGDKDVTNSGITLKASNQSKGEIQLRFVFFPAKLNNAQTGFIKVVRSDLDRVNNTEDLIREPALSWSAEQSVKMNPLYVGLLWVFGILLGVFIFWMGLLKRKIYRRFNKNRRIIIQSPFFKSLQLKGKIQLLLSDEQPPKQKFMNRWLRGKQDVYSNPFFQQPIIIKPRGGKKIWIQLGTGYTMEPFKTLIEKGQTVYIVRNTNKEEIKFIYN